ncbi:Pullulanase precursor [Candidatus Izimaplasma bacterium HR1]|uniref:type I pullulanase n=1 Tax=Candidatus Izimoplasma sp. HR1 TaxID=1541959 RepID=UPI0004F65D12|nr:Pullulanase precursor [Candidatus Izimaplasma bacterium HR1]
MKLRKLILTILFTIVAIFAIDTSSVFASTANKLVIHYHRYDDNYSDWDMWLWPSGSDGSDYAFNGSDTFGATADITLSGTNLDTADSIGILIKDDSSGSWVKDFDSDRFIDMTNPNGSGEVHVYFLQGEEFFSYVSEDQAGCNPLVPDPDLCAIDLSNKLIKAYINEELKVEFLSGEVVTSADITIYENEVSVPFTGFTSGENGQLTLTDGFDITANYGIEIDYDGEPTTKLLGRDFNYDSTAFVSNFAYDGSLGYIYTPVETTFKVWAPLSNEVELNLYNVGHTTSQRSSDGENTPYEEHSLTYLEKGVWQVTITGDLDGKYYTYDINNSGNETTNIQDPYGVSFGLNGQRSMVLDLDATDPLGWGSDSGIDGYTNPNEAIIYELHVRDLTSATSWGGPSEYAGTYMGLTVEGTTYTHPTTGVTVSTGLDHLIELGITHLHLLPTYDQDGWNNETDFEFNWGYNPQHFNSPEGGYATDPFDGAVRVNEYKQMVMALHENGINVINDVVYNHVADGGGFSLNRFVPYYFSRINNDGSWSNGTGVGNETATERYMVNKFIVDSTVYWAEEFHIDGFRFDLMAVHDYENMNNVADAVEAVDPDIFVYGEPWGGGTIKLDYNLQAGKNNLYNMPEIAAFNDIFRNALKGSPDGNDKGYVSSGYGTSDVINGIKGNSFGMNSSQSINYVSAHDNLTLYDKLVRANGYGNDFSYHQDVDYQSRLANSIVLFSQGIPFLHAGVDFLRTKGGEHNSYNASDLVNQLSYVKKANNIETFNYYKGIIEIRKQFDSFKMVERTDINSHLSFLNPPGYGLIGYNLTKNDENILVYHNSANQQNDISLPSGAWTLLSDRDEAGLTGLGTYQTRYPIEESETLVFVEGNVEDVIPSPHHLPVITSSVGTIYDTGIFSLKSNTDIYSYSLNGGDFITVVTPSTTVQISDLEPGDYEIVMKDAYGSVSTPYTLRVLEFIDDTPLVCDDGFHNENEVCVADPEPLVCDDDQTELNGECVDLPKPIVCLDGETVEDGECVKVSTGCFGGIASNNSLFILGFSFIGFASILFLIRKNK